MKYFGKLVTFAIIALLGLGLWSCGSSGDEPKPVEPPVTQRTVLLYIVANNNLGQWYFDEEDLAEIDSVRSSIPQEYKLMVYHSKFDKSAPELYEVTPEGNVSVATYTPGVSHTVARMRQVFDDVKAHAPANAYGLILWSHATGWLQDGEDDPLSPTESLIRPLTFGSEDGKRMNLTSLRTALEGQGFDYVYFDACYMATVEVAYELRKVTKYIVGSPSELPAGGMPYDKNLMHLLRGTRADLIQAATNTFSIYNAIVDPRDRCCTMAVIDTAPMEELAAATRAIYEVTPLKHPGEHVTNYRSTERNGQSCDFAEYVRALGSLDGVDPSLLARFNAVYPKVVLYAAATDKLWGMWPMYSSNGLSTLIFDYPEDITFRNYDTLQWAADVVQYHIHD